MSEGKILEVKNYKTVFTPELVTDLFSKVRGHSSLANLAKKEPLPFNGKEMMIFTMDDEVNIVGESGKKTRGSADISTKTKSSTVSVFQMNLCMLLKKRKLIF